VARRLRGAATSEQGASEQAALRIEFDACRTWLAQRAADAPGNYLHLLHLLDAEFAWASGDYLSALRAFDSGITAAHRVQRPWHQALLTERAALLHLSKGSAAPGSGSWRLAYGLYKAWGAEAKLLQMSKLYQTQERHGAAMATPPAIALGRNDQPVGSGGGLTSDTIDLLGYPAGIAGAELRNRAGSPVCTGERDPKRADRRHHRPAGAVRPRERRLVPAAGFGRERHRGDIAGGGGKTAIAATLGIPFCPA